MRGYMNRIVEVIRQHGISRLAREIGVPTQTLWNWLNRPPVRIPAEVCAAVEKALGHKLRRWHLRPTDWHQVWPELVHAEGAPAYPAAAGHPDVPESGR